MIREGALLAGKYRVERLLGAGGMGYVVAALHEQLDQRVAVKLLAPGLCENKDAVTRFLREARAAVRIQSEHVARVLDVDELDNGAPYMVMEFLSGHDLARELDERGQLPARTAIDYLLQACEAVAEAHSLGVIHRDLKPANLFLTRRPDGTPLVKVLDFGISKAISSDANQPGQSLTAPQSLLGSPAYMSPEQIRRPKTVDIRTDIWSFGSILHEFLSGESPFRGETPMEVLAAVVSDQMPSIREKRPDVSRELEAVVAKCLEKNPDDRYQTVAELAQALAPHASSASLPSVSRISGILRSSLAPQAPASTTMRSISVPPGDADTEMGPDDSAAPGTSGDKQTQTDWGRSQSIAGRSRRRVIVALASGAALVAAAAFLLLRSKVPDAASEPTALGAEGSRPTRPEPSARPPLVTVSEQPGMQVVPAPALSANDAGARRARATEAAKPKAARAPSATPKEAPAESPASRPGGKAPQPQPTAGEDPLEGRR